MISYKELESEVEVKISGDGAPFSRLSSFILLSYSLPSLEESLSSKCGLQLHYIIILHNNNLGNYTIAIIKGKESYDVMEEGFAPVLEEINSIVRKGYVMIGEKRVQVAMYFGGVIKLVLTIIVISQT